MTTSTHRLAHLCRPTLTGGAGCLVRTALAALLGLSGCQSLLGIHDGKPGTGGAGGGRGGEGTGGGAAAGGTGTGGEPSDAGVTGGRGAAGSGGGAPGDGAASDTPVGSAGGNGTGGDGAKDGGNRDLTPSADVLPDGGGSDLSLPDAGTCATPWRADNVAARILTPNPSGTACSIPGASVPAMAAGVDMTSFRGAAACGACIRVQATTGATSIVVPVVEKSSAAGILLTRAAMDQIATPGTDLTNVDWVLVPCEVGSTPVRYYIKDGTNAGYLGLQVRNARYPLASVSVVSTHGPIPLALQGYNYWESTAAGAGPLTLRLTDINGQTFEDPGVKLDPQTEQVGKGQFPLCR